MGFDPAAFTRFVVDQGVVGFFESPVKLKSGRVSNWYVNWRRPTSDVFLMDKLTDYLLEFLGSHGLDPQTLYGVPEGATKTAVVAQFKRGLRSGARPGSHALSMGRAKPKEHGDPSDRLFVGAPVGRTVVIEDVTTTGGSLYETIEKLRDAGVSVIAAVSLTNREERSDAGKSVEDEMRARFRDEVRYLAMSSATQLLPEAVKKASPAPAVIRSIEQEFARFGTAPLKLG